MKLRYLLCLLFLAVGAYAQLPNEIVDFSGTQSQPNRRDLTVGNVTVKNGMTSRFDGSNVHYVSAATALPPTGYFTSGYVCTNCPINIEMTFAKPASKISFRLRNGLVFYSVPVFPYVIENDRGEKWNVNLGPWTGAFDGTNSIEVRPPWENVKSLKIYPAAIFLEPGHVLSYWNYAIDDLSFSVQSAQRQRFVLSDLTDEITTETTILSAEVPKATFPLGSHFKVRVEKEVGPGEWRPLESGFVLGNSTITPKVAAKSLFPGLAVVKLAPSSVGAEKEFQAAHLGEVLLSINATQDRTAIPMLLKIAITAPAQYGRAGNVEPNSRNALEHDAAITAAASRYGVPPQLVKAVMYEESDRSWNPNSYLYEPFSDRTIIQPSLHDQVYADYRLATRSSEGGRPAGQYLCWGTSGKSSPGCIFGDVNDVSARNALRFRRHCGAAEQVTDEVTDLTSRELVEGSLHQGWQVERICDSAPPTGSGSGRTRPSAKPDPYDFTAQTSLAASYGLMQITVWTAYDPGVNWEGVGGRRNPGLLFDNPSNLARGQGSLEVGVRTLQVKYRAGNGAVDHVAPDFASKAAFDATMLEAARRYNGDGPRSVGYRERIAALLPLFLPRRGATKIISPSSCAPVVPSTASSAVLAAADSSVALTPRLSSGVPAVYRWYAGARGDRTQLVDEGSGTIVVRADSTPYWVEMENACGAAADQAFSIQLTAACAPPLISQQPESKPVERGQPFQLAVSTPDAGARFEWYEGEPAGMGPHTTVQISSSPTLDIVAGSVPTKYYAVVKNSCGEVYSEAATVTPFCNEPQVTASASAQTVNSGVGVRLTAMTTGTPTVHTQWYTGRVGDTSNRVSSVSEFTAYPTDTTTYWARVSNACGADDSDPITIIVRPPCLSPTVTVTPALTTIDSGESVTLSVAGSPSDAHFQWYEGSLGDTALSRGTTPTIDASPATSTSYWVRVTSSCGATATAAAIVNVSTASCEPPKRSVDPVSSTVITGQASSLTAAFAGATTIAWYVSEPAGTPFVRSGVLGGVLPIRPSSTAYYFARAENACGSTDSTTATVVVVPDCAGPPTISGQVGDLTAAAGIAADLWVTATGTGALSYEWYVSSGGAPFLQVADANGAAVSVMMPGTATYFARVRNACGEVDSSPVTVTRPPSCVAPVVERDPLSQTLPGHAVVLDVGAVGTGLSYQWYSGTSNGIWTLIEGAAGPELSVNPISTTFYYVHVSGTCGAVDSNYAIVTVVPESTCTTPSVTDATPNLSITAGTGATLTVVAAGTPSTYEWFAAPAGTDFQLVPNENGPSLSVRPNQSTYYFARLTNECGTADSRIIRVSVTPVCTAPNITNVTGGPLPYAPGEQISMSVSASGTDLRYQWYRSDGVNVTAINGAVGPAYSVVPTNANTMYWVVVTNFCGSITSGSWTAIDTTACTVPSIDRITPLDQTIVAGTEAQIVAEAHAQTAIRYQWYEADLGTLSWVPVGTSSSTLRVRPEHDTWYEVEASTDCGRDRDGAAIIRVR